MHPAVGTVCDHSVSSLSGMQSLLSLAYILFIQLSKEVPGLVCQESGSGHWL